MKRRPIYVTPDQAKVFGRFIVAELRAGLEVDVAGNLYRMRAEFVQPEQLELV